MIAAIGTYLPPWGSSAKRVPGLDEDVVTMAVAAGLGALAGAPGEEVRSVVLVSRDLPLIEGGNSAPLLAGLGLAATLEVREQLGGAPAALAAVAEAPPGTLVVAADVTGGAGAGAVLVGVSGAALALSGRINRSMPVLTRDAYGHAADYADPRLLRDRGVGVSLAAIGLDGKVAAVAGLGAKDGAAFVAGPWSGLPATGACAAVLALAIVAERGDGGSVLALEQATATVTELAAGSVPVARGERAAQPVPAGKATPGADIPISLAAYDRAFDAKLRLEAAKCRRCGTLAYPHRYRCLECGSEGAFDVEALPRDAEIYTMSTIHVPVPGLVSPYSLVLVELGGSGVRVLVQLTGAPPGSAAIGDRGTMVFRRVAVRSGVPDYGYGFLPGVREEVAA